MKAFQASLAACYQVAKVAKEAVTEAYAAGKAARPVTVSK
jgi:hypothetical protein